MSLLNRFRPATLIGADELRRHLEKHEAGTYNLVDVRSPGEYSQEHLPGATLIPLDRLEDRASELDPTIPTFTY